MSTDYSDWANLGLKWRDTARRLFSRSCLKDPCPQKKTKERNCLININCPLGPTIGFIDHKESWKKNLWSKLRTQKFEDEELNTWDWKV